PTTPSVPDKPVSEPVSDPKAAAPAPEPPPPPVPMPKLPPPAAVVKVDYNRDVRPILSNHCYACHGPDEGQRQAKLRLDRKEDAFRALRSGGRAIVAGNLA